MDQEVSSQQQSQIEIENLQDSDYEKKPEEKKKRIKKDKQSSNGVQANGIRNSKKQIQTKDSNQLVLAKKKQPQMLTTNDFMQQLGSIQIPEQLKLFFMRELRQTVPVVKELLPSHKFLLFGEIPLDLDYFINKLKIRKIDSNGSIFDKFRSIVRNIRYKDRIEFDLNSQYLGLTDFQYIIEALRSMNNNTSFQFAQNLQEYQNQVRYIIARNDYYKKYLQQQNNSVDIEQRVKQSLKCAEDILESLDGQNEIFIYNIISKQFDGLITLKKGFSKGLIKNLDVSDDEFIKSVQENKVFNNLIDQVNHASIIYCQTKMEENPYMSLRQSEIIKSIHPDIQHHHSHQFKNILRNLVKEAIKKQDVIEQFLQTQQSEMAQNNFQNYLPNPLPSFQQYQKFIKNINLHPQRFKFPPHKQIELFQNITQVLTKKQQSKINFQQNLQKITQSSPILQSQESSGLHQQDSFAQEDNSQPFRSIQMHQEPFNQQNSSLDDQNSILGQSQQLFDENSKEKIDEESSFNQQNGLASNGYMNIFKDKFNFGSSDFQDDNLSVTSQSHGLPFLKSLSQSQQLDIISQGVVTSMFNQYNDYQNSLKMSVLGSNNIFEDENSQSLFYDKSQFKSFQEENQSFQIEQGMSNNFELFKENNYNHSSNEQFEKINFNHQNSEQYQRQRDNYFQQKMHDEEESYSFCKSQSQSHTSHKNNNSASPQNGNNPFSNMSMHKQSSSASNGSENSQKENKIKDFYEQLLQYIGNDEEEDGLFPFPHINSTFKEDIIREYEQIRSILEDGKYMSNEEFNQFIEEIKKQPRIKKKQYLKHLMKIPDYVNYEEKERRKKEEKERRKQAEKIRSTSNSSNSSLSNANIKNLPSQSPKFDSGQPFKFIEQFSQQSKNNQPQNQAHSTPSHGQNQDANNKSFGNIFNFSSHQNHFNQQTCKENDHANQYGQQNQFLLNNNNSNNQDFQSNKSDTIQEEYKIQQIQENNSTQKYKNLYNNLSSSNNLHSLNEQSPIQNVLFPFKHQDINHPPHPPLPHPLQFIQQIREYFQQQKITDQSELLKIIKNNLQEAVNQGQLNSKIGQFLSQENNFDKASYVINQLLVDKDALKKLNNGHFFPLPHHHHPHHHFHHHHHHFEGSNDKPNGNSQENNHHHNHLNSNPHKRQEQVIKKIYELNTNLSLDNEIQINDYLEVFYIGKTKLWKNFSKDFILNNSFRDIDQEFNTLAQNQLLQKFYPQQCNKIEQDLRQSQQEQFQNKNSHRSDNSQSSSPQSKTLNEVNKDSENGTKKTINKELLKKIINQFKMGPPHPFKILLILKKSLQKIIYHIPKQYLTQEFLKNSLKMIVYQSQGDVENFIQCRQRVPMEIIESMEKKVMKKFCKIPII
ncbi:hypothetical protein TTHERM_00756060 (macronuclear) [Tetrahymena thermophila SB210]|uniref:Uncharacterized protein n=1 Tax=Tetrahymena thermophila (strain SB210) TaxID=312017 RepID=I7LT17_TETTS|nr:hypothetical protein TTHERM_00756060 [Tetrahymena thermophila SB210]EAR84072.1 hypothetical protein TTHERM_00756060 [Tetrahymena thermophila SB210]|eukprot:XP_001031735.1 hypothetical protein TTHERM_00756060 [Tetrahymena thermophila SB210]